MSKSTEYIGKIVNVKMDRKLGSKHPKHGFYYLLNYGFIPNTISGDGEELDAYVLGVFAPIEEFTGIVIAVIQRTDDNKDIISLTMTSARLVKKNEKTMN